MNYRDKLAGETEDKLLSEALANFKSSVDAWSEAEYSRPRSVAGTARPSWRRAAGWALALVLALVSLAGWMAVRHRIQGPAQNSAQQATPRQAAPQVTAPDPVTIDGQAVAPEKQPQKIQANNRDEDLLATVDSEVSQQVPAAMDPLAQLMYENSTEQQQKQ